MTSVSIWIPPDLSFPCLLYQTEPVARGPAPQGCSEFLQNMLGNTLGCSSPAVAPPDPSWGFVAAPPASPGATHGMEMEPPLSCGILEERFIFFSPSEGIQCYSVESSVQVEFLGSKAVVCLHLKIWPLAWKQAWASFSSFIRAVLSQGQGAGPAQLSHCSQLLNVSK